MLFYSATVKLKKPGDTSWTHEITKEDLSPAEVLILKHIHSDEGVTNIRQRGERNVKQVEEIDRLRSIYNSDAGDGKVRDLVREVFGAVPNLPRSLDLDEGDEAEVEVAAAAPSQTLGLPKKQ